MRLDKFLKISRVIKRRTVANEAADNGRVSVNGKVAKPSYDVKTGDIVEKGQPVAEILNPLTCEIISEITAPEKSVVFFHIASPLIVEGTVIFKLIRNKI